MVLRCLRLKGELCVRNFSLDWSLTGLHQQHDTVRLVGTQDEFLGTFTLDCQSGDIYISFEEGSFVLTHSLLWM